ncbi:DUF2971 domain-containing protein [Bhargavaea ullalensis]|uniref:DUF2971 domain-containing protein n=1 Tax=Bhargavaea ullalensis TaxID=1265685 RepID=A0ABV2GEB2_9BACL
MTEKFDLKKFAALLADHSIEDAIDYKNECIPARLYKFFPLYDERRVDWQTENELRLASIRNAEIWASAAEFLNDPFEFKAVLLDESEFENVREAEMMERLLDRIRRVFLSASFTANLENFPMWAHYTNNYQGFCAEYEVTDGDRLFPVIYAHDRRNAAVLLKKMVHELHLLFKGELKPQEVSAVEPVLLYLTHFVKHDSWDYEEEYRIVPPNRERTSGKLLENGEAGLRLSGLYLGNRCRESDKLALFDIAREQNLPIREIDIDDSSTKFKLTFRHFRPE